MAAIAAFPCDDHMDLAIGPRILGRAGCPLRCADRAPHIAERDGQAVRLADGKVWAAGGSEAG